MKGAYALAGLALILSVAGFFQKGPTVQEFGATPGPDSYVHSFFHNAVTNGGRFATSTNDTTATSLASDFRDVSRYDFTPNVAGITLTLPATSTMTDFIPKAGMTRQVFLCNATSTAATPFTLAFGSGMNAVLATSTLAIGTDYCADITFSRQSDSDIDVFYDLGY